MDNNELTHWGVRGMRWGVRRYQNKDGSLTAAGKKRRGIDDDNDSETVEAKRARLLKSTDASELYKNRSLLTTAEINERLNRIDTERRLSEAASRNEKQKKTAIDKINTALKYGNKINEVYNFTQTPVMKALKKKLFGEKAQNYSVDLDKIWKNKDNLPTEELQKAIRRSNAENALKKALDDYNEAKQKAEQKLEKKIEKEAIKNEKKEQKKLEREFIEEHLQNKERSSTSSNSESLPAISTSSKWENVSLKSDKYSDLVNSGKSYIDDLLK